MVGAAGPTAIVLDRSTVRGTGFPALLRWGQRGCPIIHVAAVTVKGVLGAAAARRRESARAAHRALRGGELLLLLAGGLFPGGLRIVRVALEDQRDQPEQRSPMMRKAGEYERP